MSSLPPTGPPTGPVDGPPGFGGTPVPAAEPPPRRSAWPVVVGVLLAVALVLGGLGLGFVLFGGDDDTETETEDAAPPTTAVEDPFGDFSDPFGGDLSDLSDLLGGDLSDPFPEGFEDDFSDLLPEGFEDLLPEDFDELDEFMEQPPFGIDDVQATLLFTPSATPAQVRRVEEAWEAEPLLSGVIPLDADELNDLAGGSLPPGLVPPTVTAFGAEEDAAEVREFVCSFADDPGVQLVQILGTDACDQST